jgi:molybdopterin/thiamine biosynthesis adenylyltransferase
VDIATQRNLGFISGREQQALGRATVAIGGAGGDGGSVAVSLARMGVGAGGGEIRLADPDNFELENLNRQVCCTTKTVGQNKAEVVAAYIRDINPAIKVTVYSEGVTPANVREFLDGADLLIDETEFTRPELAVSLAQEARRRNIPNLQVINVGFGAQVTTYKASSTYTLEKRLGLPNDIPPADAANHVVPLANWVAGLPGYMDVDVFHRIAQGEMSAPSVVLGVNAAASIAGAQVLLLLTSAQNRRPRPVYAPNVLSVDSLTGSSRMIRFPKMQTKLSLFAQFLRTKSGRTPRVD